MKQTSGDGYSLLIDLYASSSGLKTLTITMAADSVEEHVVVIDIRV